MPDDSARRTFALDGNDCLKDLRMYVCVGCMQRQMQGLSLSTCSRCLKVGDTQDNKQAESTSRPAECPYHAATKGK